MTLVWLYIAGGALMVSGFILVTVDFLKKRPIAKLTQISLCLLMASIVIVLIASATGREAPANQASVGDDARLFSPALPGIPVATDSAKYQELSKLINAGDNLGAEELAKSGAFFRVSIGPKVKVIEISGTLARVRFLEGASSGQYGWVEAQYLWKIR